MCNRRISGRLFAKREALARRGISGVRYSLLWIKHLGERPTLLIVWKSIPWEANLLLVQSGIDPSTSATKKITEHVNKVIGLCYVPDAGRQDAPRQPRWAEAQSEFDF